MEAKTAKLYENYVFDLYGTLVDICTKEWEPGVWEKLALFYGYYGALYAPEELEENYQAIIRGKESVQKSALEAQPQYAHEAFPEIEIEQVFRELFGKKGVHADEALSIHAGQFFRVLSTEYVRLYEGVPQMLEAIHAKGKKIYLLSNAQRIFTEYEMHLLDISKYFDGILISSEYGTRKPDIRFYEILLSKYDLKPKDCIMIGNDVANDILGAKAVGMDTYYIHSNISPECRGTPDATYYQMEMDIAKVCKRLGLD